MEILAPAGNINQAIAAMNSGCDALYGGLKEWNARNRALNFTVDEYKMFLEMCHENGVKFYMTVNTLLKNNEISDILKLFHDSSFPLPDAVIAADIGLIITLRQQFPTLDIHASTQFGACTEQDLAFLEQIGVKRAILARELTFNEIKYLCEHTSLEIEVFGYGSQCIAFSGQCLWGGVLNGCSGNRGRCIGMCRDLYQIKNEIGQFMYPQDINAVSCLKALEHIGVKSVKIEGRLRSAEEISEVVRDFKTSACSKLEYNEKYIGYLGNDLPVKGMLCSVNPRTKSTLTNYNILSENDLCIQYVNNKEVYTRGIKSNEVVPNRFVKCIYTNVLEAKKINISIKIIVADNYANKIDFINSHGERRMFNLKSETTEKHNVDDIYNLMKMKTKYNIYEFTTNVPSLQEIHIDLDEVNIIVNQINDICAGENLFSKNQTSKTSINDIIETKSCKTIMLFKNKGYGKFIYDVSDIGSLKKAISLYNSGIDIIFKTPILDFNIKIDEIFRLLIGSKIMLTKLSHILYLKKYHYTEVFGDYTLNIWNKQSADFVKDFGISSIVLHPELSYKENSEATDNTFSSKYIVSYGKLPLAYTRACFSEVNLCSQKCNESFSIENISKGYSLKIACDSSLGVRKILSEKLVGAAEYKNCYRIVLADYLSDSETNKLLNFSKLDYDIELYRRTVN